MPRPATSHAEGGRGPARTTLGPLLWGGMTTALPAAVPTNLPLPGTWRAWCAPLNPPCLQTRCKPAQALASPPCLQSRCQPAQARSHLCQRHVVDQGGARLSQVLHVNVLAAPLRCQGRNRYSKISLCESPVTKVMCCMTPHSPCCCTECNKGRWHACRRQTMACQTPGRASAQAACLQQRCPHLLCELHDAAHKVLGGDDLQPAGKLKPAAAGCACKRQCCVQCWAEALPGRRGLSVRFLAALHRWLHATGRIPSAAQKSACHDRIPSAAQTPACHRSHPQRCTDACMPQVASPALHRRLHATFRNTTARCREGEQQSAPDIRL